MQPADLYPASSIVPRPEDPSARSILVVDDAESVRNLMSRWLESGGYTVATASTAEEALDLMEAGPSAVALCDIRLPGHDGLWLADRIRHAFPETAVIVASGVQDVGSIPNMPLGVVDFLMKPFGRDRLREAVWRGMEWHTAAFDSRRLQETLERDVRVRQARLADAIATLQLDSDRALEAMLSVLTLSCHDSYAHAYRVATLAVRTAKELGLGAGDVTTIQRGALLHDFGKLAMPESLLRKPAPLSDLERRLIRQHPTVAYELIAGLPYLQDAAVIVRDAQERVDGLGYPQGSRGDEVSIAARIVCVADAYDTMTRPRSYREAISPSEAIRELERCAGSQFDRRVVEAFARVMATS
ncbi:MAG TPA: HD domain-containing phosphohydrolase [Vicinamibacterales bacterium]|nr:HD domain-containing phosphohydrolase [Vicinamibacterales bacterium]